VLVVNRLHPPVANQFFKRFSKLPEGHAAAQMSRRRGKNITSMEGAGRMLPQILPFGKPHSRIFPVSREQRKNSIVRSHKILISHLQSDWISLGTHARVYDDRMYGFGGEQHG